MRKILIAGIFLVVLVVFPTGFLFAEQNVLAAKVSTSPDIDGNAIDEVWLEAQTVVTHDSVADIDITLKAVYTDSDIFFLVIYPDADESRFHKAWVWDADLGLYKQGPSREDVFVMKWSLHDEQIDLSVYADSPHEADVWFWKADRTDPSGYADDKIVRLTSGELENSRPITTKAGDTLYLQRLGDDGTSAYENTLFLEYEGDVMRHFENREPNGSRADIKAKGLWNNGQWCIEFQRKLQTGNTDDVQFDLGKTYQFGFTV